MLQQAEAAGLDLAALAAEPEHEGVAAFCASYRELLDCIEVKVRRFQLAASLREARRRSGREGRDARGRIERVF